VHGLRRLAVLENKHIPPAYLRASIAQRRELLAGLVDTDGHLDARGYGELCFMNEALARGACELLATLGEQPHLAKGDAVLNGIVVGVRYRIHWRPVACPAALARKASRYQPPASR
jgi:hypothetical protein